MTTVGTPGEEAGGVLQVVEEQWSARSHRRHLPHFLTMGVSSSMRVHPSGTEEEAAFCVEAEDPCPLKEPGREFPS